MPNRKPSASRCSAAAKAFGREPRNGPSTTFGAESNRRVAEPGGSALFAKLKIRCGQGVQAYLRFPGSPGNFKPANEALVKFDLNGRLLSIGLLLTAAAGYAQDQPAAQPTPQTPPQQTTSQTSAAAARAPAAPKETPSTVNTGGGWSIEPMYWLTTLHPVLRPGEADVSKD